MTYFPLHHSSIQAASFKTTGSRELKGQLKSPRGTGKRVATGGSCSPTSSLSAWPFSPSPLPSSSSSSSLSFTLLFGASYCSSLCCCFSITQSHPTLLQPCSLPGSSVHGDSPGKNTGVGCHSLLQGLFPTQGSNLALQHCRRFFTS